MGALAKNTNELLMNWHRRLRETQFSHYEAAKPLSHAIYWLGIPVVVLSTFVGTSVFATLQEQVDIRLRVLVGFLSVAAAVLASLQMFLRFSERAEQHRTIAARAGSLRREVEQLLATTPQEVAEDKLNSLRAEMDKLAEDAPSVSEKIWARTNKILYEPQDRTTAA
jgi:hypothetical protein